MPARISSRENRRSGWSEVKSGAGFTFAPELRFAPSGIYKCVGRPYLLPGSEIIRLATSLFQMNSTSSAPMVAVMKPAP